MRRVRASRVIPAVTVLPIDINPDINVFIKLIGKIINLNFGE